MRHSRSLLTCIGGFVLVTAVSAAAQDSAEKQTSGLNETPGLVKDKGLSGKKQFDQAKSYMQKMQAAVRRDEKKKELALQQKDLIKLNCLNEKLSQGQGHVQEAEQALTALSEAIGHDDGEGRSHELSRIRIYYQKVLVLSAEAENCAGEEASYVGGSQIEVEVDPTVPQGDPTDPGLPTPNFTMPPPGVEQAAPDSPFANPSTMGLSNNPKQP